MNCAEFQQQLTAWLHGETDDAESGALETHAANCADCQALLTVDKHDEDRLRSALRDEAAAQRVAERAIARLETMALPVVPVAKQVTAAARRSIDLQTWLVPLLSTLAGFLLAWGFLPRTIVQPVSPPVVVQVTEQPKAKPPVAHLVASTGTVEHFDPVSKDWIPISSQKQLFACPPDSRLRTSPNTQCELETADGSVIRMNDQTEVTMRGSSSIELQRGQLWCRSPGDVSLEVRVASQGGVNSATVGSKNQSTLWCIGPSCVMTDIQDSGQVQVVNAEGDIQLRTASGQQSLDPGQVAEISNGEIIKPGRYVDPILSTRWMQPLLITRGSNDAELSQRVDKLLAEIGRAKIATLYEQEIRALGEHAVLPLVRFIQSPLATEQQNRRLTAMQLTADLAPIWLIPDLIDLLADRDPHVRRLSALTLRRLTGLEMGLPAVEWDKEPDEAQKAALADWRAWWAAHRDQYPAQRVRITKE
ncbi:zf-HC2 domain-containing protein [Anatilimnocola sp. NA78]|uniref:zf-HC2 domain-containing protein n=1 Tax=Anatilimnocola sp. NA78 TaxID=3415683 RepID=UPI003CE594EA